MVNTSLLAASLAALSAATTTSAFVHVIRRSTTINTQRASLQLHATESFQRSLLEERLGGGTDASPSSSTVLSSGEDEKFQRSLLQAKLAYDAIDAALSTTPSRGVDDVDYDSPKPINPSQASGPLDHEIVVDDECYMGKDGQLDECADFDPPKAVSSTAATSTPEPVVVAAKPKPVATIPEPIKGKRSTEFTVPRELAIVPINEATVQFTAGTIGGVAGLVVGGPVVAALSATIFNYLSRKDEDKSSSSTSPKKIVDTAALTALHFYNFLAQFEKDNKIVDSAFKLMEKVVDKAKESEGAGDVLVTLESTLGGVVNKVEELNDDYDLIGGAGTVLGSVGDLLEVGLDKVVEANEEYKFTERVGGVVKNTVEKVTEK